MSTVLKAAFQRDIYAEMVPESGLLVLGRGLGLFHLVKAFVELYASPKMLVFLLNASPEEESILLKMFTGGEEQLIGHVPFKTIKNDTLSKNRLETYLHGGVISITSRIMLIDLLKGRIPAVMTTGILLMHANRVTEYSLEAFIIDLFRSQNQVGFVKGFCEEAESLVGGFAKVEKLLKFLKTPKLFLYPRFHMTVKGDLDEVDIEVEELYVEMTPKMKIIQLGILEILETCLNEVIRANPSLDIKEFNMETAITNAFDQQIRRQLDPIWHRVGFKSRQLIGELRILRVLLEYLSEYDAITFCKFLETLIVADVTANGSGGFRSYWLMLDTAQSIIKMAKERVFNIGNDGSMVKGVEGMPKWRILESSVKKMLPDDGPVLIMVRERHTARQLMQILSMGVAGWQDKKYEEYIRWKKSAREQSGLAAGVSVNPTQQPTPSMRKKSRPGPSVMEKLPEVIIDNDGIDPLIEIEQDSIESTDNNLWKIFCYDDIQDDYSTFLEERKAVKVILYDVELSFIRALEVYTHCQGIQGLSVTMLVYKDSVEEQLHLLSIRQEKEAFEQLIRIRSNMAPQLPFVEVNGVSEEIPLDRFAGNVEEEVVPRTIIVDLRELRSSLPFVLHKRGFKLEPITIDVGDYILTPDVCIERKSVSDLISSLNSGRLYTQVEQMFRAYSTPILLIEFDEERPFTLLPTNLRSDISISDISSKLCLLLLHFPKLKIIWSASLAATADIFGDLKRTALDPVLLMGGNEGIACDPTAKDMLMALPGVNQQKAFMLMRRVRDLRSLCKLTLTQLSDIIGSESANKLYNFLHTPFNK